LAAFERDAIAFDASFEQYQPDCTRSLAGVAVETVLKGRTNRVKEVPRFDDWHPISLNLHVFLSGYGGS
jgi:hypothetical protein